MKVDIDFERITNLLEILGAAEGAFQELADENTGLPKKVFQAMADRASEQINFFKTKWNEQHTTW